MCVLIKLEKTKFSIFHLFRQIWQQKSDDKLSKTSKFASSTHSFFVDNSHNLYKISYFLSKLMTTITVACTATLQHVEDKERFCVWCFLTEKFTKFMRSWNFKIFDATCKQVFDSLCVYLWNWRQRNSQYFNFFVNFDQRYAMLSKTRQTFCNRYSTNSFSVEFHNNLYKILAFLSKLTTNITVVSTASHFQSLKFLIQPVKKVILYVCTF